MRVIVATDVHANLPALRAALTAISNEGYDVFVHTGDAIGIGPYPSECLELLLNVRDAHFVMGNHESYFVNGLPTGPSSISDVEAQHQLWTHSQLDRGLKPLIAKWPYRLDWNVESVKTIFVHYALTESGQDFLAAVGRPTLADLDRVFSSLDFTVAFYGHDHFASDVQGRRHYVNPGSLGVSAAAFARYAVADFSAGKVVVEHRAVAYDQTPLFQAFEERHVPGRQFIQRVFFQKVA